MHKPDSMHKGCQSIIRSAIVAALALLWGAGLAFAQGFHAPTGSIFPTPNDMLRHHMSPTGKPCLTISGYAQAQTINNHIYEHWIGAANACGQNIKLQVCYHSTQDCITMDVPPYGRKDSILGIYPASADFRYDAKEQF